MLEAAQILLKSAHREPRPNFEPRILLQKGRNMQHMFQNMGGGKQTRTKVQNNQMKAHVTTSVVYRT